jgi:hypothetical protein
MITSGDDDPRLDAFFRDFTLERERFELLLKWSKTRHPRLSRGAAPMAASHNYEGIAGREASLWNHDLAGVWWLIRCKKPTTVATEVISHD